MRYLASIALALIVSLGLFWGMDKLVLMCNKREAHIEVLDNLPVSTVPLADALLKKQSFSLSDLKLSQEWKAASEAMKRLTS